MGLRNVGILPPHNPKDLDLNLHRPENLNSRSLDPSPSLGARDVSTSTVDVSVFNHLWFP